jgi:sterol desaturase/sphingolipid hydroxylase (fatty acid hydroxylase superfamily)
LIALFSNAVWSRVFSFANGAAGIAALAIPLLIIALALEALASGVVRRDGHYDRKDTLTNLALAVGNTLVGKAWGPLAFAAYTLGARVRLFDVPMQAAWAWVLLFLGDDVCYYWSHRAAHRLPLLWASHQVHHTSRRFNLSVGARNSWTGGLLDWLFWMPLALLGFPPVAIVAMQGISLSWQFLVHSAYGGRLGPLGLVLNTPSHHRVHHGRNPQYLDRNFGGTLIVWDRLFGSFRAEREPVDFGAVDEPARPYNPIFIAFSGWAALVRGARRRGSPAAPAPPPGS